MARYQKLLTTADVAEILAMPHWRVIKFVQGKEYGIKPAFATGKGSGSRRLYDVENVCELAVAVRLLETGLRSKVIGKVIKQLHRVGKKLSAKLKLGDGDLLKLNLTIIREPRTGQPLDETGFQWVGFLEGPEHAVLFISEDEQMPEGRILSDIIFVPLGPWFLELKNRLGKIGSEGEEE